MLVADGRNLAKRGLGVGDKWRFAIDDGDAADNFLFALYFLNSLRPSPSPCPLPVRPPIYPTSATFASAGRRFPRRECRRLLP